VIWQLQALQRAWREVDRDSPSRRSRPGKFGLFPGQQFEKGQVIYADSSVGTSTAQLLYQAIGAGNLRLYVQGQDDVGHAGLAN
jgi:hypothetical protein